MKVNLPGLVLVATALLPSCGGRVEGTEGLVLEAFRQAGQEGVLLNEPLVMHFSEGLDPSSVTRSSARIFDSQGRNVGGSFEVHDEQLVFHPRLPRRADLNDAGFLPGEEIQVELLGFPAPSGLRSRSGELLSGTYRTRFRVTAATGTAFLDESPDGAAPLILSSVEVGVSEALELSCDEPLDPRSLSAGAFELKRYRRVVSDEDAALDADGFEAIPLEVVLVENRREGAGIELRALEDLDGALVPRALEPGEYHLWVHEGPDGPRDLGGHPVRSAWALSQLPATLSVAVRPEEGGSRVHREDFLSRALRSPAEVPGLDGTATWDGRGVVRLRLPRAAGDGSAGVVVLAGDSTPLRAARGDLHASSLVLPAGARVDLSDLTGPAVLRSQGSLHIQGDLFRSVSEGAEARDASESWGAWFGRLGRLAPGLESTGPPGSPGLATWIEQLRASGEPWTVLVAAGDLVIDGSLVVDGPLLLAAGGRMRFSGVVEARSVLTVGEGGGVVVRPPARAVEVAFEPPQGNPLVAPLRVGVLSAPFRPGGRDLRWRSALVGSRPGAGLVELRFLGERTAADGRIESIGPVEDASLLDRCDAIRLWIELEIGPGPTWDPPMVDFVDVRWIEEAGS